MMIDDCILYLLPHILSTHCRKSRNNLFSIRNRSTSFCISCFGGCPSFRGRPFGFGDLPYDIAFFRLRYLHTQLFTCSVVRPNSAAISLCTIPASFICSIIGSICIMCVYLRFDIIIPPNVVLLSYIRGHFVYCPLLLVLSSNRGGILHGRIADACTVHCWSLRPFAAR